MAVVHKVDIFKVLGDINKKNQNFYTSLNEDEQKALHPLVLMKWMGGVNSEQQVMMLNQFANPFIFSLADHKQLLMDLLVVCSPGKYTKYKWNKVKKKKTSTTPTLVNLIKETYNYSSIKAAECLPLLDDTALMLMATDLGKQSAEIKDIKKELRLRKK